MITERAKLFWAMADCLNNKNIDIVTSIYGDLDSAMVHVSEIELIKHGIPLRTAKSMMKKIQSVNIDMAESDLYKYNVRILSHEDDLFPDSLKNISDPPLFLFAKGDFDVLKRKSLAVVGSRMVTNDGIWACKNLLPDIINSGFTIVSGMALGVDTLAHKEAIKNNGSTVAFWGTGFDRIYPSSNTNLAYEIMQNGVVFTEFPFGSLPNQYNFPRRNRLISGYSDGVLVIEGKEKSGSLITADFALEQGKEVFAVPGSIRSVFSVGPNKLIQDGAKLVYKSDDILSEFGVEQSELFTKESIEYKPNTENEKQIYQLLTYTPYSFDYICKSLEMTPSDILSTLMIMSLNGAVEDTGNGYWVRR